MNRFNCLIRHSAVVRILAGFLLLLPGLPVWGQPNILTQHNDNARTGANLKETVLNTSNVNVNRFGKLFTRPVDGVIYAQPLYVSNLPIPGKGTLNVVYVATVNGSVYAFDADHPTAVAPLWHAYLSLRPQPLSTDARGIIGTPVIDLTAHALYCVVSNSAPRSFELHALDISTGRNKVGSPVTVRATVPGTGAGSSAGVMPFIPDVQKQRPGLLLGQGVLYIAFGSAVKEAPGDHWNGWIFAYNAATLQRTAVFCVAPNANGGGIWQSCGGLASDGSSIYAITSNGVGHSFTANHGGVDYGDCFLKLSPASGTPGSHLAVTDWFAPFNESFLDAADLDVGNTGPLLIPGTNLLLGGDKQGKFFLLQ